MQVAVGVAEAVVVAVVTRPPQRPLLRRAAAADGHDELHGPPELVAAVGEVAVVPGGDEEHAHHVQDHAQDQRPGRDAGEDRRQAQDVHQDERDRGLLVGALIGGALEGVGLHVGLTSGLEGRRPQPTDQSVGGHASDEGGSGCGGDLERGWAPVRPIGSRSVAPPAQWSRKGVDQFGLVHLGPAVDADLLGPLAQLVDRAVLVALGVARPSCPPWSASCWPRRWRCAPPFSLLAPSRRSASYCSSSLTLGPGLLAGMVPPGSSGWTPGGYPSRPA